MEKHPKLLAIGWNPMHNNDNGTLIYLLEDEELFYGYAQHPDFNPRVKPSHFNVGALRWCRGCVYPKGNENVRKLYLEALDIIRENKIKENYDLIHEYFSQKELSKEKGKEYWNIDEQIKRTLADPELSKYFL
ncbi:MAG: hypothetical protein LBB79_06845 [Prevotellaceae bacterium]|jgi:hypothetical protein|nr:hypothetical protein [Prevotellaceae bacterium]